MKPTHVTLWRDDLAKKDGRWVVTARYPSTVIIARFGNRSQARAHAHRLRGGTRRLRSV